ncbi:MAG: hypothetical protein K0Q79_1333 [Flavipsychrobacter sp.]|jgi:hypothetical protein|nr:hypothetical protein [Flavipsychrobacter sp.]
MIRRQITDLAIVSIKFFLDIDPAFCAYAFVLIAMGINNCKQIPIKLEEVLYNGIQTVKQDYQYIKRYLRYAVIKLR